MLSADVCFFSAALISLRSSRSLSQSKYFLKVNTHLNLHVRVTNSIAKVLKS